MRKLLIYSQNNNICVLMFYNLEKKHASEYAELMLDNGIHHIVWDIEMCPIIEIEKLRQPEDAKVTLSLTCKYTHEETSVDRMILNVYENKFVLFTSK